jgi:hypothetical protein
MTEELILRFQKCRAMEFKLALNKPDVHGTPECIFNEILWVLQMPEDDFSKITRYCQYLEFEGHESGL